MPRRCPVSTLGAGDSTSAGEGKVRRHAREQGAGSDRRGATGGVWGWTTASPGGNPAAPRGASQNIPRGDGKRKIGQLRGQWRNRFLWAFLCLLGEGKKRFHKLAFPPQPQWEGENGAIDWPIWSVDFDLVCVTWVTNWKKLQPLIKWRLQGLLAGGAESACGGNGCRCSWPSGSHSRQWQNL